MSSERNSPTATGGMLALLPKMRFPEFESQPLRRLTLGDVTSERTDRNGGEESTLPIMGVSKIDGLVPMEERLIAANTARYKLVRRNCFAYNPMRLNIGSIARWPGEHDVLVSPDYVVFECESDDPGGIEPDYLDHFRRSDAWEAFVSKSGDGGVRVRIYYKDLARLELALPSPLEQQKITHCLDSIDELIVAQRQKVEALRAHKRGLMQQLFPQEGQTQPRLRFLEFEASAAWKTFEVSELAKVTTGSKDTQNKVQGGKYPFFVRSQTVERIDTFDLDCEAVLTSGDGVGVGKNFHYIEGRFDFHQRVYCIFSFKKRLHGKFFYYYFSEFFGGRVRKMSAKNSVDSVRMAMIAEMPILLPSPQEQERIADCLTSLDDLLAAEIQKLDTLKSHKKGVMQQLFPRVGR